MDLADVDIHDPDAYVAGVPHALFRRLRAEAPVFWQELPEGRGYWALTRHADVVRASQDPASFSAARGGILIADPDPTQPELLRGQLLCMDPPEHARLRRAVLRGLTPARVDRLEPWIRTRTRAILDAAAEKGECDLVKDLAGELPLQVIAEIMGVPAEDRGRMLDWADRIVGRDDPELAVPGEAAHAAALQLGAYGFELAKQRSGREGDLVALLLGAGEDGRPLDALDFAGLFVQLAVAGNETTRTLLSGGILALLEEPGAWRALAADRALLPTAVEELLRWVTPVHYFRRTATRELELRGQRIRAGDRVVLLYASANRDEAVFAEPDRLDLRRDPNPHLAFGWGEHFCLGARLARLEARVFLDELVQRFERVELCGPPRRLRSNLNNAWKQLPVRLVPRLR